MKNLILIALILIPMACFSQNKIARTQTKTSPTPTPPVSVPSPAKHPTDYGWTERLGFMAGIGASSLINTVYENVTIEKANNTVIIEQAGKIRSNITLGIAFTPYPTTTKRKIATDDNGTEKIITDYKYYPKGFSVALFLNPINVTSISKTTFNSTDFGAGIGYRTGDFAFLATLEMASMRQPREYFIKEYKDNKLQYKVNNNIQTSVDVNDDSIYRSIIKPAIGFKIAYTISIFKNYASTLN